MRVSQIKRESSSVLSLVLEPGDGVPLAAALPGQFVILRMKASEDAPPLLRNYSLSGPPGAAYYRASVKQEAGGLGSTYLHTKVRQDDVLDVSAPRGSFTLLPGDGPVVLVSAGVGATPVLAMLHSLASNASEREVWWLHGSRSSDEHPFREEARTLLDKLRRGHSHIQYSRPGATDRLGADFDAPGHLDVEGMKSLGVPRDADFYLCGPPSFLVDLTAGLATWGVASHRVHSETFGPGASMTPGVIGGTVRPPHAPAEPAGTGPRVAFARSGLTVTWDERFLSLLELAEACDVPVRWSCRTGVCHNCESGLISGTVSYRPEPLLPPAEGNLLMCCCKPAEDVVVDL
jgi:ferredoxin-NADP reductase